MGEIVGLFIGKPVDLVKWQMPTVSAGDSFEILLGPIIPPIPLFVNITGSVEVAFNFGVGIDTRGLQKGNFLEARVRVF